MPSNTQIEQRNKAIISLQALCGLRISELRTIKLKNIIEEEKKYFIDVNPKNMSVKFAKQRNAYFLKLDKDIFENVLNWKKYLINKHNFKKHDPLFPIIPKNFNQDSLLEEHLMHESIKSNTTIRNIFKKAFIKAGYEYLRPHSFKHTIVRYAETKIPEFLNAIRRSLGHKSINTSFQSYGELAPNDCRDRININKINI